MVFDPNKKFNLCRKQEHRGSESPTVDLNSDDVLQTKTQTKTAHSTSFTISTPANVLPASTHTVDADTGSLIGKNRGLVKNSNGVRKRKKNMMRSGMRSGMCPMNTLNESTAKDASVNRNRTQLNGTGSSPVKDKRKRKKRDVYIADIADIAPTDQLTQILIESTDNHKRSVMDEFDVNDLKSNFETMNAKYDGLFTERKNKGNDVQGKETVESVSSKFIHSQLDKVKTTYMEDTRTSDTIEKFHKDVEAKDRSSLESMMMNNKERYKRIKDKWESEKEYIRPDIIKNQRDIELIVTKHKSLLVDILEGRQGSYFYNFAKQIKNGSSRSTIRSDELLNLPKNKYFGYIGAVRGFQIGKQIEQEMFEMLHNKRRHNAIVYFWGVSRFCQYVLAPEVIARLHMELSGSDVQTAYDEMELANEYGLLVTDTLQLPADEQEEEEEEEDDAAQ